MGDDPCVQDKVIGTRSEGVATIYDVTTGQQVRTLKPKYSNEYSHNRACFDPTDELVLSDGVLWDCRAGREIHKLDKLNQTLSGVFHPGGMEIISNTEVWDIRTFHLLRTVPQLDQCQVRSPTRPVPGSSPSSTSAKFVPQLDQCQVRPPTRPLPGSSPSSTRARFVPQLD